MSRATLFIDNGGYTIKALYVPFAPSTDDAATTTAAASASASASPPLPQPRAVCLPNCIGAAPHAGTGLLGEQLIQLPHYHGVMLRRPVDRGFIVDGALQARVWEHILQHFAIEDEAGIDVWVTVPHGTPKPVAQLLWLLCTRSFRFASVTFVGTSFLAVVANSVGAVGEVGVGDALPSLRVSSSGGGGASQYNVDAAGSVRDGHQPPSPAPSTSPPCRKRDRGEGKGSSDSLMRGGTAVAVDVGFSGTTIIPYVDYLPVMSSAVRLDIGGKLLTNRLKEFLSFSQVNVMEDTWLINHVREVCCVAALRPWQSLRKYAALWKGKSRADVEANLPATHAAQPRRTKTRTTHAGDRDVDGEDKEASGATEMSGDARVAASPAAAAETPLRYFLPTIPALLPLGVVEADLPSRLPRSSAVDASALQHLLLCHERFVIPELLFAPSDLGVDQQGLAQAITEGIFQRGLLRHVATLLRPQLLQRVCVYGGTAETPMLRERLAAEVTAASSAPVGDADDSDDAAAAADGGDRAGVRTLPSLLLPDFIKEAAAKGGVLSPLSLHPLLGALYLLCPSAAATAASPAARQELTRLRALVTHRSTVALLPPAATRITVEDFQVALRQVL